MEAGPQANQQSDPRVDPESTEAYSEADEEDCTSRGKTPDTNVKLNQPLRCGRYGQDLISHKERQQHSSQAEADREQGQKAGRLGAGGKVDPGLIASRQSSTAPPAGPIRAGPVSMAQPQGKGCATHTEPRTGPLMAEPSQQPATMQPVRAALNGPGAASGAVASGAAPDRAPPGGPPAGRAAAAAPASVDDLLTGPSPVLPIMTASMAGEAAAMAVSAAALAKPAAANNPAVKAVLGQHYRAYRAKMAAAEQRSAIPPRKPQGQAPAKAAVTAAAPAAAESANRGSQAGPSGQQHSNALPEYRQHRSQSHAAGAITAQENEDAEDVPLRVKYGSSSSGGSSRASWQVSAAGLAQRQDTATTLYTQAQQPQQQKQPSMHDKDHQRPSRKGSRNADVRHGGNSASQQAQQDRGPFGPPSTTMRGSQSTLAVRTEGHCQLPGSQGGSAPQCADPEDVEIDFVGGNDTGVGKEQVEDVGKSNDKLDMLLHSTVKHTQQGVLGKENQVKEEIWSLWAHAPLSSLMQHLKTCLCKLRSTVPAHILLHQLLSATQAQSSAVECQPIGHIACYLGLCQMLQMHM